MKTKGEVQRAHNKQLIPRRFIFSESLGQNRNLFDARYVHLMPPPHVASQVIKSFFERSVKPVCPGFLRHLLQYQLPDSSGSASACWPEMPELEPPDSLRTEALRRPASPPSWYWPSPMEMGVVIRLSIGRRSPSEPRYMHKSRTDVVHLKVI